MSQTHHDRILNKLTRELAERGYSTTPQMRQQMRDILVLIDSARSPAEIRALWQRLERM